MSIRGAPITFATVACLFLSSCGPDLAGRPYTRDLAPTLERLVTTYADDLATKRFEIVAVFEQPAEQALFRLDPPGPVGAVGISTERARPETGAGALKMSLSDPSQRVVCADSAGAAWSLPRDWSKYHLLLMSVFSPRKLSGFQFAARSGPDLTLAYQHPRMALEPGWNLLRIDLGDLGEQIDLADVRELRFGCDPLDSPVDLYLDDLILVDNARDVFVTPEKEPGDLYVRSRGRRLVVGSVDRFELVFARGQIRQWFDLARDPTCAHNLVGPGPLGPLPVVVPPTGVRSVYLDDNAPWSSLGSAVQTYQSLVDAGPLCAVIQGQWRFAAPDGSVGAEAPVHEWRYTVCHDGRLFVECVGAARGPGFQPSGLGVAFSCDRDRGFHRELLRLEASGAESQPHSYALFSRPERDQSDLLVVPAAALAGEAIDHANDPRLAVMWALPPQPSARGERFLFAAMLRVWPPDIDSIEQADPFAADYARRPTLVLEVGQLVRTDPGDFDNDGFSEGRGYHVIQLDGNTACFTIDGRKRMCFSPVFKIVDVAGRDVWIYRDGKLLRNLHRDADGNVLFEITGVIAKQVLVEITSRPHGADAQ